MSFKCRLIFLKLPLGAMASMFGKSNRELRVNWSLKYFAYHFYPFSFRNVTCIQLTEGKMRSKKGDLPGFIKVKYVGCIATIQALTFPELTHLAWFHFYVLNSIDWMNAWLLYQAACAKYLTSANLWQAPFINLCFIILTSMHTLPFCPYLQVNWFLRKWRGQQMLEHTFFC